LYIGEDEVRAALTYDKLIPAIGRALEDYSAGRVEQPARMILRAGNAEGANNGWFAVMPAIAGDMMGVKTVTFYPGNATLGLPTHMAVIELLRRSTGAPLAVMDGRLITEMRTAAVSATAFCALAPLVFETKPRTLGILGSGVQARAHIEALRHVWPELESIAIWGRTRAHAERLARETGARAAEREEAAGAEVVLTVTSAPMPVLEGRHVRKNALVLAVGATGATMRELDDDLMRSSFVVGECKAAAERESGDVKLAGVTVGAEIGQLLVGQNRDRVPRGGRVVSKSVGMAIEDLTAARLVWEARGGR